MVSFRKRAASVARWGRNNQRDALPPGPPEAGMVNYSLPMQPETKQRTLGVTEEGIFR